jgi:hypothetical protein
MSTHQKMHLDTIVPLTVSQVAFSMIVQGFVLNSAFNHLSVRESHTVWIALCLGFSGFILQAMAVYLMVSRYVDRIFKDGNNTCSFDEIKKIVSPRLSLMFASGLLLGVTSITIYLIYLGTGYGKYQWMLIVPVLALIWASIEQLIDTCCK